MEAVRARFGSAIEWLVAAAFIVIAAGIVSLALRELRTVSATSTVVVRSGQRGSSPRPAQGNAGAPGS